MRAVPYKLASSYLNWVCTINLVVFFLFMFIGIQLTMFQIFLNTVVADIWWWKKYDNSNSPPSRPGLA